MLLSRSDSLSLSTYLLPLLAGDDLPGAGHERNSTSTTTASARAEIRSLMAAMLRPAPAARPSFTSALERLRCAGARLVAAT